MAFDRWLHVARMRLRSLMRHGRVEDELGEELKFHLDERIREIMARGMSAADARDEALRAFGGLEQRKEECRDTRRVGVVEDFVKDIAYALRLMRRSPASTTAAVLSLGIGIGAATAIFNVFDAFILRPLPVDRPEQLRTTHTTVVANSRTAKETDSVPYGFFRILQADTSIFSEMLATRALDQTVVSDRTHPLRTPGGGITVSANYFTMLGIRPALGRLFDPRDGQATDRAVVLSDRFWRREFGADPTVLGKAIEIDGQTFTVIGVTPASFFGLAIGRAPDFFVTVVPGSNEMFSVQVVGRLQAHVTDAVAGQWMTALWQAREFLKPNLPSPQLAVRSAESGLSPVRQRFAQPLSLLIAMVGLLLLIACANVATMQLSRASARKTEILIRSSIGAGNGRLLRQLMAESALLVAFASAAGLLLASWGTQTLLGLMQSLDAPLTMPSGVDVRVILFAVGVSALACVLTGLAPALHTVRLDANSTLRDRSDTRAAPVTGGLGRSFVVAQVALSLALVAAAGLLARTLYGLTSLDAGFTSDGVATVSVDPGTRGYRGGELTTYFNSLSERFGRLPGVERVSLAQFSFLTDARTTGTIDVPGFTPASDDDRWVQVYQVGAQFFRTLNIPIVDGRDFDERDLTATPIALALNETAARRYFGSQPAVGRSILGGDASQRQYRIIAVVRDGRYNTLREDMEAVIFLPYTHSGRNRMTYLVKFAGTDAASGQLPRLLDEARAVDPLVPIQADTLDAIVGRSVGQERLLAIIAVFFGLTALLLLSLGLYGIMAYWVAARTPEIGVRLALGARRSQVVWQVVRRPLALIAIGLLLGIAATIAGGRYASHLLYGLAPQDPLTLAGSIAFLGAVALIAGAVPARRASRVDPVAALRSE
jgi:predicted permease